VDVRIGVTQTARELTLDMADDTDRDRLRTDIEAALAGEGVLWLTDRKGRTIGVPVVKIAYIEIAPPDDKRKLGFGS
jgi:Protein of unknown function (DUF3107)